MATDIKICGLKTEGAVDAALAGGATHIGFIFFPKSPRYVEPEIAGTLRELARGRAKAVAVTVDADDGFLGRIVSAMKPDMLQLQGKETPERAAELRQRYGIPVMKALSISAAADLDRIQPFLGIAERFLFDAKPPSGSQLPGGNGVSFDWRLLSGLDKSVDYMLAGGLNAGNVGDALRLADPPGVDISSGVESAPGVKDVRLIEGFFQAIRAAQKKTAA